jgi:hypothetical protein
VYARSIVLYAYHFQPRSWCGESTIVAGHAGLTRVHSHKFEVVVRAVVVPLPATTFLDTSKTSRWLVLHLRAHAGRDERNRRCEAMDVRPKPWMALGPVARFCPAFRLRDFQDGCS